MFFVFFNDFENCFKVIIVFLKLLSTGFADVFSQYLCSSYSTSSFSSLINLSLSFIVIELLKEELLYFRNHLTKFQNCLVFEEFLPVHFLEYRVFSILQSEWHLFVILFIAKKFFLERNFKYLCLHLDLFIIAFLF